MARVGPQRHREKKMKIETYIEKCSSLYWSVCHYFNTFVRNELVFFFFLPSRAQVERVIAQPVQRTATYRCDDTRGCIIQFCPPDDEHMCSKHVEA